VTGLVQISRAVSDVVCLAAHADDLTGGDAVALVQRKSKRGRRWRSDRGDTEAKYRRRADGEPSGAPANTGGSAGPSGAAGVPNDGNEVIDPSGFLQPARWRPLPTTAVPRAWLVKVQPEGRPTGALAPATRLPVTPQERPLRTHPDVLPPAGLRPGRVASVAPRGCRHGGLRRLEMTLARPLLPAGPDEPEVAPVGYARPPVGAGPALPVLGQLSRVEKAAPQPVPAAPVQRLPPAECALWRAHLPDHAQRLRRAEQC